MSDEKESPSMSEKAKNLARYSWDLINYLSVNKEKVLFTNDEQFAHRLKICHACESFKELENECVECGCYVPAKAKIILDSCPLHKWDVADEDWEEKFGNIMHEIGHDPDEVETPENT